MSGRHANNEAKESPRLVPAGSFHKFSLIGGKNLTVFQSIGRSSLVCLAWGSGFLFCGLKAFGLVFWDQLWHFGNC